MPRSRSVRPLPVAALAMLTALLVVACGSGSGAGWTYAPAAAATPVPSGAASGSPDAATPDPSGSLTVATPIPSQPSGTTVTIVATSFEDFDTPEVSGPAGQPFSIVFDNQDPVAPHNVYLTDPSGAAVDIGDVTPFTGPEQRTYDAPALEAGVYPFICQVHLTTMIGTLTLQ
jgi:plastocyanin